MTTRTDIMNMALSAVAANNISSPDDESPTARQCKLYYEQIVGEELQKHAWSFAKAQASVAADFAAPAFRYARQFTMPDDFLRLVELEQSWVFDIIRGADTDAFPTYELQGNRLLTDLGSPLGFTYIRKSVDEPAMWPPLFVSVVAGALARRIAFVLTKSDGAVKMADAFYQDAVRAARRSNAIQHPPRVSPDGSWTVGRF